jgi:hypothetical protein
MHRQVLVKAGDCAPSVRHNFHADTMTRNFIIIVFILFGLSSTSQELTKDDIEYVTDFVRCIKKDLRAKIASDAHFPLRRQYPIPPVMDSVDFLKRFSEIFDESLLDQIKHSKIPNDWSHVGWRGLMLYNGVLWIEDGGGLKAVNHQSLIEKNLRTSLIEKERSTLHTTMREYAEPTCIVETEVFRIRVDKLKDGTYRYSSWKKSSEAGSLPDLQISGGTMTFDGSGGNHRYIFANADYRYEIEILLIGADADPPAKLLVYQAEKEIVNQPGTLNGD